MLSLMIELEWAIESAIGSFPHKFSTAKESRADFTPVIRAPGYWSLLKRHEIFSTSKSR
jgi:hypothetical protein